MDLGLANKKAIVCASSKGLGKACANSLVREGCDVVINARNEAALAAAAADLRAIDGGQVTMVLADINTAEGRAELLKACPEPDILVNNNAGPPPGDFNHWGPSDWQGALYTSDSRPADYLECCPIALLRLSTR